VQLEETKDEDDLTFGGLMRENTKESFTQRVKSGEIETDLNDLKALTFVMMRELNNQGGRTLLIQHKLIEIFRAAPKFVSNYL